MKQGTGHRGTVSLTAMAGGLALVLSLFASAAVGADPTTVYATAFETDEGYNVANEISGQNGWISEGSGGNGILSERFPGGGSQAYVGFHPPLTQGEQSFSLWRPVNYDAVADGKPIVAFSVAMEIADSTNENRDDFRWSVYNSSGHRLFTLSFNNATTQICYALDDDAGFQPTPYVFENETVYALEIVMDFSANRWSANMGNAVLVENQPITTSNADLDLGDIDAVWYYIDANAPGDNFMVFDDYRITAQPPPDPTPAIQILSRQNDGSALLRLVGLADRTYSIEASEDLVSWTPLKAASSADGVIDHLDNASAGMPLRFYRARLAE